MDFDRLLIERCMSRGTIQRDRIDIGPYDTTSASSSGDARENARSSSDI
jgi:hypothetical protein